ncbi:MAG: acyltransferase [Alphaproteobacteria bacterium]|nr:acyltransferase [Alphaproteobacteria bacterium]
MTEKRFRNDITSLRAIAVVAVVIFHISPNILGGGYLGVDIFFVISGFLITSILLKEETSTQSISLINFYRRRLLRIWPALIVFLLLSCGIAFVVVDFKELPNVGKEAMFSAIGAANIYFYKFLDYSYFAPDTNTNIFLHLWSLGIEAQFYLFFPFIILIAKRKYFIHIFTILFVLSLASAIHYSKIDLMLSYYMLHTRAFSLLLGSIVAYLVFKNKLSWLNNKYIANTLLSLSLVLILISVIFVREKFKLPNGYSLLAIVPAGLIIAIGSVYNKGIIHKILENKVFIAIGLWSFSIYLYHWLLVALYHNFFAGLQDIPLLHALPIFFASILLGWLSYKFVEQPCLKLKWNFLILLLVFIAIPFGIFQTYRHYSKHNILKFEQLLPLSVNAINKPKFLCYDDSTTALYQIEDCVAPQYSNNKYPNIIMWGDSNASHYVMTVNEVAKTLGFSFINIGRCRVFNLDNKNIPDIRTPKCYEALRFIYKNINNHNLDIVILSSRWIDTNMDDLSYTIKKLSQKVKMIIIVANVYYMDKIDIQAIINSYSLIDFNRLDLNSELNQKVTSINKYLKNLAKQYPNVYFVDFNKVLCSDKTCQYKDRTNPLYDIGGIHLSIYGGGYIGKKYIEQGIDPVWYKVRDLYKLNKVK